MWDDRQCVEWPNHTVTDLKWFNADFIWPLCYDNVLRLQMILVSEIACFLPVKCDLIADESLMNDSEEQSTSPGKLSPRDWRDTMVCTCRQFGTSWAGRAAGVHGLLCWVADQCHWVGDMVIRIQNRPGFECVNMCKLTEFGGSPADVKILDGGFQWRGYGWRSLGAQLEGFAILGPWTSPKFMTGIHNWMVAPSRGNFNLWVIFWAVFGPKKVWVQIPDEFLPSLCAEP